MWDDINPFYAEKVLKKELAKNEEKNNKPVDNKKNLRLAFFIIDMPIVICAFAGLIIYGILSNHLYIAWIFIPILFISVIGIILFTFLKRDKKKTKTIPTEPAQVLDLTKHNDTQVSSFSSHTSIESVTDQTEQHSSAS